MQNNAQSYLKIMFAIVSEAGGVALKHLEKSKPTLKKDASVITLADKEISRLCRKKLQKILQDPAHLLIDEEDPHIALYLDQGRLDKTSFLWALDPIDGTRLYANRMPMFGISLGLMKDLKPWLGVVYFPLLKELFYCDGRNAYFVQNAFSLKQKEMRIKPIDQQLSPKSIFFCNDTFFNKFGWADKDFHIMINACAVVNLLWPAIGRGVGCFLRANLWDFAGCWPIIQKAGFDFRSVKTGKVINSVHVDLFNSSPKPWELKEYYLISSKKNYFLIKSKIVDMSTMKFNHNA
ncbi:MAG: inositol monophosphatase family protein [Candidatus Omnitrophota bacterium]